VSPLWIRDQLRKGLHPLFRGDNPFELLDIQVHSALEAIRPKRLLLMLDEFDKIQEGIENQITSPQVPENIRYLFHTYPALSGIISGSRRLKHLRDQYWHALFGIGNRITVGVLDIA